MAKALKSDPVGRRDTPQPQIAVRKSPIENSKASLRVSVRTLAAHSLRSGDLSASWEPAHPLDGVRIHQQIQKSRGDGYRSEVQVSRTVRRNGFELEVQGRIDGVLELADRVVIEEIKSSGRPLEEVERTPSPLHWGQARIYAFIYAETRDLGEVEVRLTYCHRQSGEIRELSRRFKLAELREFFFAAVDSYLDWQALLRGWRRLRDEIIRRTPFPYPDYRAGQRKMAVTVYRTVAQGGQLLVQATTGIGKTMAVVFPVLKSLPEGLADRLFYLTARTTGKAIAEKALWTLRDKGVRVKSVTLTAREKICFNPDKACNGAECEYARGYYDRIGRARDGLFEHDCLDRAAVEAAAREHSVCPFALSIELARWADVVVCDYHYLLSPSAPIEPLGLDERPDAVLAIDEAHNLVDRSREMHSALLRRRTFLDLRRRFQKAGGLRRSLESAARRMGRLKKKLQETGVESVEELPAQLLPSLRAFADEAETWLSSTEGPDPGRVPLLEAYFDTLRFLRVAEEFDERYVTCFDDFQGDFSVKLFCLDPSPNLARTLGRCRAAVLFSATLSPAAYLRRTLGCREDASSLTLPSPFEARHLAVLEARVSTVYRRRESTADRVARLLETLVAGRTGQYLFFFPSYDYLQMVLGRFRPQGEEVSVLVQQPDMSEQQRDDFLQCFSARPTGTLAGFAVMGGVFGEGIDLTGERLAGAAVVGVGLPGMSAQRERLRSYFSRRERSGFDFAYRYPGMQRALQAAGRVIRTGTDRGVVLLIDERFSRWDYRRLLPREWKPIEVGDEAGLRRQLERFWGAGSTPASKLS